MSHSYMAFIDESGDDGFKNFRIPSKRGGSSHWLVISAIVLRKSYHLEAVKWRDEIVAQMPDRKGRELHFANLNHGQKLAAAKALSIKPIRSISILSCKEKIPEGIYAAKNQLYFYLCRHLIERISWLCRDMRPQVPEGNGKVAITFSRRGGMNYQDFRYYLSVLKSNGEKDCRIHWTVIDLEAVEAKDHSKNASLQLADIIASAVAAGVEPDLYNNCEERYSEILKPITYQRKGSFLSYGIKSLPKFEDCGLSKDQVKMMNIWK